MGGLNLRPPDYKTSDCTTQPHCPRQAYTQYKAYQGGHREDTSSLSWHLLQNTYHSEFLASLYSVRKN